MTTNNSNEKNEPFVGNVISCIKPEIKREKDEAYKGINDEKENKYIDDLSEIASCSGSEIKSEKDASHYQDTKSEDKNDYVDDLSEVASCSMSEVKLEKNVPDQDTKNYYIDVFSEVASSSGSEIKSEKNVPDENTKNGYIEVFSEVASCSRSEIKLERDVPIKEGKNEDEYNYIHDDFAIKDMPENYRETYEAFVNKVKELSTVPILQSVSEETIRNFKPFNIRYYEDKYCIHFGTMETVYCDINVRIHTNKLLLIALASGNDIIRSQRDISEINFVINNVDRSNVKVTGKKKKGSRIVEPYTILCQVKYQGDDKMYNVRAGVSGRVIEINELIKKNPNLIRKDPKGSGFIAVIAPKGKPEEYEKRVSKLNLLSEEEYFQHLIQRPPSYTRNYRY